ncbi:MAG: GGDEF domain-containing protein [Proteobacteria bacterium]|nr:GGDEF domain-containing protein [Pseudomonadota bacterium]
MLSQPTDRRAEEERRALHGLKAQRKRFTLAAAFFSICLMYTFHQTPYAPAMPVFGVAIAEAIGFFLLRARDARFPCVIVPICAALIFSSSIIIAARLDSTFGALHFAFMFLVGGGLMLLIAPGRRGVILSLIVMGVIGIAGAISLGAAAGAFDVIHTAGSLLIGLLVPYLVAGRIEDAHRESSALQTELARRATSDEITGVSNRAHINLLAQNEFARARRYGEPYSCFTIEIEKYEHLLASHGRAAATAVVQVLTGYCVVVMRHCDSFGRLTPSRFLGLLPETPALGARTLANRMCRDLAALDVAFGGEKLHFTVAIGCAEMHAVDQWAGDMLRRADQGLADALERGGNCAVFATVPIHQPANEGSNNGDPPGGVSP